jgi:hypothetical protein
MGCKSGKPDTFNIETEYRNKNIPMPDGSQFENEFEREAFMTINLLRVDPKLLIPQIKEVKGKLDILYERRNSSMIPAKNRFNQECLGSKLYKGTKWQLLIKELEKMDELPHIALDEIASKACRETNEKVLTDQSVDPEHGGNAQRYKNLLGATAKTGDIEEFTYS